MKRWFNSAAWGQAIRTYRVPLFFGCLATAGFLWWSHTVRMNIDEVRRQGRYQVVRGLFSIVEGTVSELYGRRMAQPVPVGTLFEKLVRVSPLRFVSLQQDGAVLFHSAGAPPSLQLLSDEGDLFEGNRFLYWRKLGAGYDKGGRAETGAGGGERILVIGGEFHDDRREYAGALDGLHFIRGMFLLFLAAGFVAWIMMIRNRSLAEQLRLGRQRLAYMEELEFSAAGLAHETKNPLGIISGIAQQVAGDEGITPAGRMKLEQILDEVDKTTARLGHFLTYARQRTLHLETLQAPEVLDRVIGILRAEFEVSKVELVLDCPPCTFLADEEMLRGILVNLLMNSLSASPAGTEVRVRIECGGKQARLIVEDRGVGIDAGLLPRLFRPYVTGRPDGHGLGLAIVKRYVDEHGWSIAITSERNRGTTVVISGIARGKAGER